MKPKILYIIICLLVYGLPIYAQLQSERGVLYPESFGAKGNGEHDDTKAIQTAIDELVKIGGGTVRLGSGTYLVSTLKIGPKVSIVGNGNGATVIKQIKGHKDHCLIVKDIAAALSISDLTVLGENENRGIYFEASGGYGENQHYLFSNTSNWDKSQAYKWITIENVCVYKFETGLFIREYGFNVNVCNSTFSYNGNGVILSCSDSFMYNCYIANNSKNGLVINGGSNKINNIKSIFNGKSNAKEYGAIVLKGSRNQVLNCETQDNYGKGYVVEGMYNLLSNCMSNTDGYSRDPYQYDPEVKSCGFMIKGLYNSFSNCSVMNYNEKYGAVYHSPVIVDKTVSYYYPDIFSDIKVLIAPDRLLFNEPFSNVQTLSPKNKVKALNVSLIDEGKYFIRNRQYENIIKAEELHLGNLQLLIDFKCVGDGGNLIEIEGNKGFVVNCKQKKITLLWRGKMVSELLLDDNAVMNKDDQRLIIAISQYGDKRFVQMLLFEKTIDSGWIKKETRIETRVPATCIKKATIKIGDNNMPVKRIIVTQSTIPESVYLPLSNTNKIYDAAIVYVDADSNM